MKKSQTTSLQEAINKFRNASNEEDFKIGLFEFSREYAKYLNVDFDRDILPNISNPSWWKTDYGVSLRDGVAIGMDIKDAFKCLIDVRRTFLFAQGIKETVKFLLQKKNNPLTAFDPGTGTGILSVLLVAYGVKKVYAIEFNPQTFKATKDFIKKCELERKIVVLEGDATQILLEGVKDVDILVSENLSTALMDEPQFEIIKHLSQYLSTDAEIIPYRAQLSVALGNADWSQEDQIHTGVDMLPQCRQISDVFMYATVVSTKDMVIPLFHNELSIPVKEALPVNTLIFRTDLQMNRVGKIYWMNSGDAEVVVRPWTFKVDDGNGVVTETVILHLHYRAGCRMTEMIVSSYKDNISLRDPFLENNSHQMRKSFVSKDIIIPQKYMFNEYIVNPISTKDTFEDWLILQSNAATIVQLRGGGARDGWPYKCTLEENFKDLAWLEFCAKYKQFFSYIIRNKIDKSYSGCLYIYPIELFYPELSGKYDVDFSFWITKKEYEGGAYEEIFKDLLRWLVNDWKFEKKRIYLRNSEIPDSLKDSNL
ncbi:50S ribosomal protein L11 methyltransferase [Candidatus Roizmanbacteria bacterium]|nr:50S ribosomal protein L11 methyltransferase [Candidatus Roizmanbacteria bacterium]